MHPKNVKKKTRIVETIFSFIPAFCVCVRVRVCVTERRSFVFGWFVNTLQRTDTHSTLQYSTSFFYFICPFEQWTQRVTCVTNCRILYARSFMCNTNGVCVCGICVCSSKHSFSESINTRILWLYRIFIGEDRVSGSSETLTHRHHIMMRLRSSHTQIVHNLYTRDREGQCLQNSVINRVSSNCNANFHNKVSVLLSKHWTYAISM